jgi:hypothetical protein
MVASFLLVAAFTPALALLSHQAVSQTEETTQRSIDRSLSVINTSKAVVSSSEAILTDLNNIEEHLAADDTTGALVDTRKLEDHYEEFSNATEKLNEELRGTETGERLSEELNTLNQAEQDLAEEIEYASRSAQTGSTISQEMIREMKPQYQNVASAAATINAEIVETESDKLLATHNELTELSSTIVFMGGIVVMLSFAIAGIASFKLSRPIRKLSGEAEKIKNEQFEEVKLGRVNPATDEIAELKNIMSQTLLAMKAEFGRERSEMNQLALDTSKVLYGQVPQGTAESSITSACKKIGVSPTELQEDDLGELADQLEITMKGLGVDDRIFDEIRKME